MEVTTGAMLISVGVAAGILAGFFGVGGGVIIVPMLIYLLGYSQKMASGTSLVGVCYCLWEFSELSLTTNPAKIGLDNIKAGLIISIGMFAGTLVGSRIALTLSSDSLRKAFAVFLVLMAVRLWMQASSAG